MSTQPSNDTTSTSNFPSPPTAYPQQVSGASLSSGLALPIPARPPGFRLGLPSAPVQVEVFIDLQCPFSAKAYATLLTVHDHNPSSVSFNFIPLCLPSHRQAYFMLKSSLCAALRGAEVNVSPTSSRGEVVASTWIAYVSFLYAQVDRFSHRAHYKNKTGDDLIAHVSTCVKEFFKEDEDKFDQYYQTINGDTLDSWAKEAMRLATKRVSPHSPLHSA
jgi:hypothetical protein